MKRELNSIITIQELLDGRNDEFDNASKVKLVRHDSLRIPKIQGDIIYDGNLYDLYCHDHQKFLIFQNEQKHKNFSDVEYIVSFLSEEGTVARFIGVFENKGILKTIDKETTLFDFQEISGFDILKDKTVVNWGKGTRQWIQNWETKKEVIRIDEGLNNRKTPPFIRYEDVKLNYSELKTIFESNNPVWKSKLEACNCVYLILDKSNGKQYVGVTYKDASRGWKSGIWNRWSEYAKTGHGGNEDLIKACGDDPNYAKENFQWSILETLPLNVISSVALDRETLCKEKFGTRDFGYNNN